ncbi:dipeptidase [Isobaculum melis]|uniref:Dipeptidase. Metallo peptidase. MEROPS family M19 n=1 Tax=Isobaculum melis TaxID=142588 RepID=A0A1H9ST29_9LACT|nr:dipeptidase [Isobaculum melis]SER88024.1 dipeptidase. Metallo peptidase. MEROPS family M19 [Isobaculum melis]
METIDLHCDALLKLQLGKGQLSFSTSKELDVNLERLKQGGVKVQAFAIYIAPEVLVEDKFDHALEQIHYYQEEVLAKHPEMKQIKSWEEIHHLAPGEIGSFLTLEGVEPIGNDLTKLHQLLDLGVLSVGLTWNPANLAADGIMEPRGAGLSKLGYDIVTILNERKVLTDVSHLSEQGFWDVMEAAHYPIASHSNARAICRHVRNLTDAQILKMIEKDCMIHVIFNPPFTVDEGTATIADFVKHIQHIVDLGGIKNIGFGSDFDGISSHIEGLTHSGEIPNLLTYLEKNYTTEAIAGFAAQNFMQHLPK